MVESCPMDHPKKVAKKLSIKYLESIIEGGGTKHLVKSLEVSLGDFTAAANKKNYLENDQLHC